MLSKRMRAAFAAALKDEPDPAVRRWARLMMRPDPPVRPRAKPKRKRKRAA